MGLGSIFSGILGKKKAKKRESSEFKKAMERGGSSSSGIREQTIVLEKLDAPEQQVISPAVEHPLLTIQDRISRLEETYRSLNKKLDSLGGSLASKSDVDDIKAMIHEDIVKEDQILLGIDNVHARIGELEVKRDGLTRKVEQATHELAEEVKELEKVTVELELLEADQKIISLLSSGDMSTIELSERLSFSRQYLWERLKALKSAGYVDAIKQGRQTKYRLIKAI